MELAKKFHRVAHMLEQMRADDEIERLIPERKLFRVGHHEGPIRDESSATGSLARVGDEAVAENIGAEVGILTAADV